MQPHTVHTVRPSPLGDLLLTGSVSPAGDLTLTALFLPGQRARPPSVPRTATTGSSPRRTGSWTPTSRAA